MFSAAFFSFFFHFLSCSFFLLNLDFFRLFPNSTRSETIGGARGANELGKEVNSIFLFCFLDRKKICVDYAKVFKIFLSGFFGRVLGGCRDNFMQYALLMGAFNNYVDRILRFLTPPLPCVDSFYTLSVDKNRHFLTPSPLILST